MNYDFRVSQLYKALVISSYGKLFSIPAIIWGQSHSTVCVLLVRLFILTSNTVALKGTLYKWYRWKARSE